MRRLKLALQQKARSIMFTLLVAIGLLQMLVGFIFDGILYGLAIFIVWVALKFAK